MTDCVFEKKNSFACSGTWRNPLTALNGYEETPTQKERYVAKLSLCPGVGMKNVLKMPGSRLEILLPPALHSRCAFLCSLLEVAPCETTAYYAGWSHMESFL